MDFGSHFILGQPMEKLFQMHPLALVVHIFLKVVYT